MSNTVVQVLSFTIIFPVVLGLIRMHRIRASYQPFLLLLLLALTSEVVSEVSISLTKSNTITSNIYTLLEAGVVLYLFYTWGFLKKRPGLMIFLGIIYCAVWIFENLYMGLLVDGFSSYFVILYSLVTVLLSINEINSLIAAFGGNLFKNAKFLICIGLIIMGVYSVITEGFLLIDPDNSRVSRNIFNLFAFINAFVNIVYAIAVWFIPVRDDYYFSKRFKA